MDDKVATLGAGRLLLLQPVTPADDVMLRVALGILRLWTRRIKEAGRPTAYVVTVGKVERVDGPAGAELPPDMLEVGDKVVLPVPAFPGGVVPGQILQRFDARWGLASTLSLQGSRFHLECTLVELRGVDVEVLERSVIDDELAEMPRHLFDLARMVCQETGVTAPWRSWPDIFDTADVGAALLLLTADGTCLEVEEGVRKTVGAAFEPLARLLALAPTHPRGLEIARILAERLDAGSAHSLAVARELRRLRDLGATL